ncbi:MAG: dTMP kinase [Actinomycetota bacterium]|nr:dTMP kinase [Actinomycetota bacterium]
MASIADEIAELRGTKSATFADLLRHKPFTRLLAAMTVSSLGDWIGLAAVLALANRLAGGTSVALGTVGSVMIVRVLPAALFGPLAATFIDSFDRRRMMILADVGRGVLYGTMAFVPKLWMIFPLSFGIECLSLLWTPCRDASLPQFVPRRQLANANSVGLLTTYGTLPLGGIIATVLATTAKGIPIFGTHVESLALLVDAGTFAFSAFMVSGIPIKSPTARTAADFEWRQIGRDMKEGVQFLKENPLARTMMFGIGAAMAATGAVLSLGPSFAIYTLDSQTAGWPILMAAFGLGMASGIVALNFMGKMVERELVFASSMLLAAVNLFFLAVQPNISLAAIFTAGLGFFVGTMWVTGYTMLQENVTDEFRGRTFGAITVVGRLVLLVALVVFPFVGVTLDKTVGNLLGKTKVHIGGQPIDLSGTRLALMVAGLAVIVAAAFTREGMKRLRLTRPKALTLVPKLKRPPATGVFIAFEGVEGAGKGTQIERAEAYLREAGHDVLVTREPGGTGFGEQVRQVVLDPKTGTLDPRAEALLFAASRAHTVSMVIRPALADGKVVLCDRYVDSSLAYQGWARGLGEQDVLTLNVWATQGLFPDLVVLLHIEPDQGLARSAGVPDRMELEGTDFHAKVADAYLKIAEEHPERFAVVTAERPVDEVFVDVRDAIDRVIREHAGTGTV